MMNCAKTLTLTIVLSVWNVSHADPVDKLMNKMLAGHFGKPEQQTLEGLGAAAVPDLVVHLKGADANKRLAALAMLQYVWSPKAKIPIQKLLKNKDEQVVFFALKCLRHHLPNSEVAPLVESLLAHSRPSFAGTALDILEKESSDVGRMLKFMKRKTGLKHAAVHLARYQSRRLSKATWTLAAHKDPAVRAAAISGLISQTVITPVVKGRFLKDLPGSPPMVQDRIGEYFAWFGDANDVDALKAALPRLKCPYAKASIQGALRAIEGRPETIKLALANFRSEAADIAPTKTPYSLAFTSALKGNAKEAIRHYARAEDAPPLHVNMGQAPSRAETARNVMRRKVQHILFGIQPYNTATLPQKMPTSKEVMGPITDYFDSERKSYGVFVEDGDGPFANSTHVGDDLGWKRDYATIVAVADGVVRIVSNGGDWGGLVVVEHQRKDGNRFCSLYSHLSPFMHVCPGAVVKRGQKVGSLGRRFTWENGGYPTHLHFGIHEGPFKQQSNWLTGYLNPEAFQSGDHGWHDPQTFLKEFGRDDDTK